jgi:hypothetical protein
MRRFTRACTGLSVGEKISHFIEDLVRPYVSESSLDEGYRAMAADSERETEAREWNIAFAGDCKMSADT